MTVEELTTDLTFFVKQLMNNGVTPNWEKDLEDKIRGLVAKFQFNRRTASFVIGENIASSVDVEVQTCDIVSCGSNNIGHISQNDLSESEQLVWQRLRSGTLKPRELECEFDLKQSNEAIKSVRLRRRFITECMNLDIGGVPYSDYDYSLVYGACCENVFGYVPLPTGIVGPLRINDTEVYIPMSTTEGALVASVNRGSKALNMCGGVEVFVEKDGMTRAPVIKFSDLAELKRCINWLQSVEVFNVIKRVFESESRFARLKRFELTADDHYLFIRFVATTGDAMGMNMITKCCYKALHVITDEFRTAKVISISGNMCVDKKASRINWERGRGKSVKASAKISAAVIKSIFRISIDDLVALGYAKFDLGARHAGCIGGANAHAANVVAAIFLATGQDAAQVVSSSMCSTVLEKTDSGDLRMTCYMPCLEVGTVGGGTILPAQQTCLKMLNCCGGHSTEPGENAKCLARIICGTVLAGELSLLASQCAGDLMKGHIKLNRSNINLASPSLRQMQAVNNTSRFVSEINLTSTTIRKPSALLSDICQDALPSVKPCITAEVSPISDDNALTVINSAVSTPVAIAKLVKKAAARCDHLL